MMTLEQIKKMTVSEIVTMLEEITGERVPIEYQLRLATLARRNQLTDERLMSIVSTLNGGKQHE